MPYLYALSIKGIQNFIFRTNQLREIIGASELIEQSCTSMFKSWYKKLTNSDLNDKDILLAAAGNVRCLFHDHEQLHNFSNGIINEINKFSPGLNAIQAFVQLQSHAITNLDIEKLEESLRDIRHEMTISSYSGLMVGIRARRTSLPAISKLGEEYIDADTKTKLDLKEGQSMKNKLKVGDLEDPWPKELNDIARDDMRNWIAIVHADGNGMGQKIINMMKNLKGDVTSIWQDFTSKIDQCCIEAFEIAASEAFEIHKNDPKAEQKIIPMRPVIIGGDDMTVIIRADLALSFVRTYLINFELKTKERLAKIDISFKDGLTACAGIAFIKQKFPFHYGVHLAEELCKHAKRKNRENKESRSSLMFSQVQDSFYQNYDELREREYKINDFDFEHGPYYVSGHNTIDELIHTSIELTKKGAPKNALRKWLKDVHENSDFASSRIDRLKTTHSELYVSLDLENNTRIGIVSPIQDWVTIASLNSTSR
ncbi:MAG: hypothetical protein IPP15_20390 [Saprospiraceae bacterium]|uniref:Cas10/Cmr2 second palm domain-containing protein n=1 Tax=Candidatus Opimibacter skivensis TaxID=2982028 RepID=A0A9D7SWT1_9BACT|nr:hypothetical protein [Candidatus Opimibacter skivensis]